MRVLLAPNSFKGSLTAAQAAAAMARGFVEGWPETQTVQVPLADGGEGTVDAILRARGGRLVQREVTGPLGRPVRAAFGVTDGGKTAVIEMAAASGLPLVPPEARDPMVTTTRGTGELIRVALELGARLILIGVGGSATVDGGLGMAQALGVTLLDARGEPVGPGARGLSRVARVDRSGLHPAVREAEFVVLCDVDNPLCGTEGAAAVFGPQKGARPDQVPLLDEALARWADLIEAESGAEVRSRPGAGAGGGLGAGLAALFGASLRPGAEVILEMVGVGEHLRRAHLAVTGEGRMDGQTLRGKAPVVLARAARDAGVPAVALVGAVGPGAERMLGEGLSAICPILPGPMGEAEAVARAEELLEAGASRLARVLKLGTGLAGSGG